jgi:adenosylcobinamide-GDP ribazoletransferase
MSGARLDAAQADRSRFASALTQIRLAATFLTILPLGATQAAASDVAASFSWFPLIGFAVGAGLALEDWLLAYFFTGPVCAMLTVLSLTAISGAVHLDGLADTADALGAGRDRMRALEILRDSRIGSFGATAIVFALALKIGTLALAVGRVRRLALYLAPGVARMAMVAVPCKFSYLRSNGAGSALLGSRDERNLRNAAIITLIALLPVAGGAVLRAIVAGGLLTLLLRGFYRRWLGGVTGDLIGAAGELVEAFVIVAVAGGVARGWLI